MLTPQFILPLAHKLVIDLFAGGGGASTGIEQAIGRHVDIAVNHDPAAVSLHQVNHPQTEHFVSDVFEVDPLEVTRGRPVGLLWASPDCFPAGTLVLTRDGYTPIEEIQVGDEVMTHKARWRKVTETSNARRPLISIKGHGHPGIAVSPEHPFLARLRKDVWQTEPRGYKRTLDPQDWMPASALDKGWYWATLTEYPAAPVPEIEGRGMAIDDKFMWLVGRYLGDGWTRLTDTRAEVVITCGKHEVDRLRALLDQWPRAAERSEFNELAWQERHTGTAYQFTTNHRGLVEWLRKHFGHRAESKRVPGWALGMAPGLRRALLDGYLSADGWDNDSFSECRTVSKALAFGIKGLLNTVGKTVTVHRFDNNGVIEGREVTARDIFMLRWRAQVNEKHAQTFRDEGMEWCPIREQEDLAAVADVFNIGVADDESYLVEGIIVHNCKHFSKAKGGKPVSDRVRGLAWIVVQWVRALKPTDCHPDVICLENVEEFATWGPLGPDGRPCPDRKGSTFARWKAQLQNLGYVVEHRELRACDYGAPTIRKRLFLVARRDGMPIVWPKPTHAQKPVKGDGLKPWRTAAECIDWTLPCPSIFERDRPLADATLRRIAHGVMRYVVNAPEPYIVRIGQTGHGDGGKVRGIREPISTVTTKAEHLLCSPTMVQTGYGERAGQAPRVPGLDKPLGTVVAGAAKHAVVAAFLAKHFGGAPAAGKTAAPLDRPAPTVLASGGPQGLVTASILTNTTGHPGAPADAPLRTVTTGGHHAAVAAFLTAYYGSDQDTPLDDPMHTVTTKPRFGLVTVAGQQYAIADIGMRMLQPRELYRAQGFPDSYIIDRGHDGRVLPKDAQVRMCGNSVCPPLARALVQANYSEHAAMRRAA